MSTRLSDFQVGVPTLVVAVELNEKESLRLESMGLLPGTEISILAKGVGPLIVAVGETRVMVEQDVAEKILVV